MNESAGDVDVVTLDGRRSPSGHVERGAAGEGRRERRGAEERPAKRERESRGAGREAGNGKRQHAQSVSSRI